MAAPAFSVAVPIVAALSKNVSVPVGVGPAVTGGTMAVKVTACPEVDGFGAEVNVRLVCAPFDGRALPLVSIVNGLPFAPTARYTAPLTGKPPVKVSCVGANFTLTVQLAPGAMDAGQLLVAW